MNHSSIQIKIREIIRNMLERPESLFGDGYEDQPLTGSHFYLSAVEMIYLFFEVEKVFGIRLEENDVLDYRFNTIAQIVDTVAHKHAVA